MEVLSLSLLRTRSVTVSPSRQRSSGPGMPPLMVSAVRGVPLKLTGDSPMNRSKSLPANTCGSPGLLIAQTGVRHNPRPPKSPPMASPLTKVRLEVWECMPSVPPVSLLNLSMRLAGGAFQLAEAKITVLTGWASLTGVKWTFPLRPPCRRCS
ncbi:hypothetical protein D9M72_571430 [compost metagenome]